MTEENNTIHIKPVDFRPGGERHPREGGGGGRFIVKLIGLLFFAALAIAAFLLFTSPRISIVVEPPPDTLTLEGGLFAINLDKQFIVRPGTYSVLAKKEGYYVLSEQVKITKKTESLKYTLKKLPGFLSVSAHDINTPNSPIRDAAVSIEAKELGTTPVTKHELKEGSYRIRVIAERFITVETNVTIEGLGQTLDLAIALTPDWAEVSFSSEPTAAALIVDDQKLGATPGTSELTQGTHDIRFELSEHLPFTTQIVVQANTPATIGPVKLDLANAYLLLTSDPSEATVTIDGVFEGKTPLHIPIRPNVDHSVAVSKPGHTPKTQRVQAAPSETNSVTITLEPITSTISLEVTPSGTKIWIDGQALGQTPSSIDLTTVEHTIEIKKEGFEPFSTTITPRVGLPQKLTAHLKEIKGPGPSGATQPNEIKTKTGHPLVRVIPQPFTMGSSRREQGRRSNETLRNVKLSRPFYIGTKEVTNREFKEFKPSHNAGLIKSTSLSSDHQPVANVTWEEAAQFCNWLSKKDDLPEVYEVRGERVVAKSPLPTGYRLPTEAEWAFAARSDGSGGLLRYPWGNSFPPPEKSGNFADSSVRTILANYLENYNDGYAVSAKPGSFNANRLGLFDLGGNVAEWCHDWYKIYSYEPGNTDTDPLGPDEGRFHVIRGSSWKHSTIGALRLSYRDYGNEKRNDVGFRVCRSAELNK